MVELRRGARRGLAGLIVTVLVVYGCAEHEIVEETDDLRQPVEVRAMVDKAIATTGDLITYRIQVDTDPDYEVEIEEAGAEIAGFRIVDVGQEEPLERRGRVLRERWYQLRADLVGSYVLPPVEVSYRPRTEDDGGSGPWQTLATSEIFIEVESVLPADTEAVDIRGLKALREVRPSPPWLLPTAIAVGVALLAVLGIWYWRRRANKKDLPPPIPAHELAFAALNRLRATDFDDTESVRRFYFQISEVIRAYVEGRFDLNATDLTSEEIVANLGSLDELAGDQNQVLHAFLMDTDQVKFAHREPSRTDIKGAYEQALGFVEATRPVVVEEAEQAA